MKNKTLTSVVATALFILATTAAFAQTALPGPISSVPVPQSVVDQAEQQANGNFPEMKRSNVGGQIQEAWNDVDEKAGVAVFDFCGLCTYKVRLRQHMITLFEVPVGEVIEKIDNGDNKVFTVNMRSDRRFAVQAVGYGVDTNLIVYGKSGNVYPFYVRAESFNSNNISDQYVQIVGGRISQEINITSTIGGTVEGLDDKPSSEALPDAPLSKLDSKTIPVDGLAPPLKTPKSNDYVADVPFNPDRLHGWGEYKLWGEGDQAEDMKPITIFRDDQFTYLKFGDKWNSLELPTAYVVRDGLDELVNTRVVGHTYIIEAPARLITLKSGQSYLCIEYTGKP